MSFIFPYFLIALGLISIPILIHLFNFRRFKKVIFSNTTFLKNIQFETKKQSQLKHILILISRILAIIFLVLAFAKPFLENDNKNKINSDNRQIFIYIDNSFSMQNQGSDGILLDIARKKAIDIVSSFKNTDKFKLFTNNDFNPTSEAISKQDIISEIEKVEFAPQSCRIMDLFEWIKLDNQQNTGYQVFLISDFQKGNFIGKNVSISKKHKVFLLPTESTQISNLYIDTCFISSPVNLEHDIVSIDFVLKNQSKDDLEKIPVQLFLNGSQKAVASVDVSADSKVSGKLTFRLDSAGFYKGYLSIQDYPIVYDDKLFISFTVSKQIKVLSISGENSSPYIESFYSHDSIFAFSKQNEKNVDFSTFRNFSSIVVNEPMEYSTGLGSKLKEFVNEGGSLFLIPNAQNIEAFNNLLRDFSMPDFQLSPDTARQKVRNVEVLNPIFKDVFELKNGKSELANNSDLPIILKHFRFSKNPDASVKTIISLENNEPVLLSKNLGAGMLYLFTSPMNKQSSNFGSHALFVPMVFNIARQSLQLPKLYYNLSADESIFTRFTDLQQDEKLVLKSEKNIEFIPEIRRNPSWLILKPNQQIKEAGLFGLYRETHEILPIAYNYDRKESDFNYQTEDELKEFIKAGNSNFNLISGSIPNVNTYLKDYEMGISLWKIFISLALLFLLFEVLLLRFWK